MRAASRESYAEAADQLATFAAGASAETLATMADEILAVARLLAVEPRLRRALADPGRSGTDRSELFATVFGDSLGPDAARLLGALVGGRWSAASEMLDGVERLGVDALMHSADRAGELGEVEDELFRFGQIVDGDPQLAAVLGDATADSARRGELLHALLDGKANAVTVRLGELALAGFGGRGFAAGLTRLVEMAAAARDRGVAYVTVAVPLTDADEERLGTKLSELYGREISLKITVDPDVVGGARVLVGNDLYDGTISRRLAEARNALAGKR